MHDPQLTPALSGEPISAGRGRISRDDIANRISSDRMIGPTRLIAQILCVAQRLGKCLPPATDNCSNSRRNNSNG
jgi:hypothetical protein